MDPQHLHIRHLLQPNRSLASVVCERVPAILYKRGWSAQFYVDFSSTLPSACRLLDMKGRDKGQNGCESHEHEDDSWCGKSRSQQPRLVQHSHLSFHLFFLFCFPDILCCALCGDQLLVRFLGPMTVRGLRKFSVFPNIKYLTSPCV